MAQNNETFMIDKPKLFFGTGNRHKLDEVVAILGKYFTLKSFLDLPHKIEVIEDQPDFVGNARKKAIKFFNEVQYATIADDTGLEVEALGGQPGVYSARYAGENASDQDNRTKLLNALEGINNRAANFKTIIYYKTKHSEIAFEGVFKGTIALEEKGHNGFGYDPIFIPHGYTQTLAELDPNEKNKISHRALALQKMKQYFDEQS